MMKRIVSMLLCLLMVVGMAAPSTMAAPVGTGMGTDDIYYEGANVIYNDDGSVSLRPEGAGTSTPTQYPQPQSTMELLGHATATSGEVTVDAVGVPEGSSLKITEADPERAQIAQQMEANRVGSEKALYTADISVKDKSGLDWQPNGKVRLELDVPNAEEARGKNLYVVHVDDDGHANYIDAQLTSAGTVVFETDGFSVFHVVLEGTYTTHNMASDHHTTVLYVVKKCFNVSLEESDLATVVSSNTDVVSVSKNIDGEWELNTGKYSTSTATLRVTTTGGTVYTLNVSHSVQKPDIIVGGTNYGEDSNGIITWYLTDSGMGVGNNSDGWEDTYWSDTQVIEIRGPGAVEIHLQDAPTSWNGYKTDKDRNVTLDLYQMKITNGATVYIRLGSSFEKGDTITIVGRGNCPIFLVEDGSLHIRQTDTDLLPPKNMNVGDGNASCAGSTNCSVDWPRDWYDTDYARGNTDAFIPLTIDGGSRSDTTTSPLIHLTDGADNLYIEDVVFQNARLRAILVESDRLDNFVLKNCVFMGTVRAVNWQGGAIYIGALSSADHMVDIHNFVLDDCYFKSNKAEDDGGALYIGARCPGTIKINNCVFNGCMADELDPTTGEDAGKDYAAHGGAIHIEGAIKNVEFTDTIFKNCQAESYGGAVSFESSTNKNGNYNRIDNIVFSNCSFDNCLSLEKHGGAIAFRSQTATIKILGCSFTNCRAKVNGGAITFSSIDMGVTFKQDPLRDATTGSIVKDASGNTQTGPDWSGNMGGSNTRHREWPSGSYTVEKDIPRTVKRTTIGSVLIDGLHDADGNVIKDADGNVTQKTTFTGCKADSSGGAFEFAHSSCTFDADVKNTVIDGCKAVNNGNAVFLSTSIVQNMDIVDCEVMNCDNIKTSNADGTAVYENITNTAGDGTDVTYPMLKDAGTYDIASGDASGTVRSTGETTCQLLMQNTKLHNNRSRYSGGGLYWNALNGRDLMDVCTAEVDGCEIYENSALQDGGGIYCESTLTVTNTIIRNNTAGDEGGGIAQQVYNNPGRMLLDGEATNLTLDPTTEMYENTANYGGGISIKANATNSIANRNEDGSYMDPDHEDFVQHSVTFRLNGATIRDNDAYINGGGIYFLAATYDEAKYPGVAEDGSDKINGDSGANCNAEVRSYIKSITIDDGLIYNNQSGCNNAIQSAGGGGIYMESSQNTSLLVSGGHIYKNIANYGNGGGIYMTGEGSVCTITGGVIGGIIAEGDEVAGYETAEVGTLLSNHASRYLSKEVQGRGGGIALAGGAEIIMRRPYLMKDGKYVDAAGKEVTEPVEDTTKDGGVVSYNTANFQGGGIWLEGTTKNAAYHCDITISSGTITQNDVVLLEGIGSGSANGGGIFIGSYNTCTLNGGEVSYNVTPAWGGGIYCGEYGKFIMNRKADGTGGSIDHNEAANGGGVCLQSNNTANIYGGTVSSNTASDIGGGLYVRTGSVLTMEGGEVSSNTASNNGGGIYVYNSSTVNIKSVKDAAGQITQQGIIKGNTATNNGGGIYAETSSSVTVDGKIIGNIATNGHGGGAYMLGDTTLNVTGLIGEEGSPNTAGKDGGGISAYASGGSPKVDITGTVQYNFAERYGGGIYAYIIDSTKKLTVSGTIQHNSTNGYGGGVYAIGANTLVEVTGDILTNTAAVGGGAAVLTSAQIEVKGGSVSYNTTNNGGAGIYAASKATVKLTVDGTDKGLISYNTSKNYGGGGIYAQDEGTVVTVDGDIMYNHALKTKNIGQGGGIYMVGGVNATINGSVSHNDSTSHGGGIYASGANTLTIRGTVSNNETKTDGYGGGIYADGTNTVNVYGTISGNISKNNGGGVAIRAGGTLTVTGGDVENNSASAGGGGIHCYGATVKIDSGNIKGNHATQFAGGMYIGGKSIATVDGDVLNNTTDGNGGGIHFGSDSSGAAQVTVTGNVQGNKAIGNGGGIYGKSFTGATAKPSVTVSGGSITQNYANCDYDANKVLQPMSSVGVGDGGGVYLEDADLSLLRNGNVVGHIDNNSGVNGGGIYAIRAAVLIHGDVSENIAGYNDASGSYVGGNGGGIYASGGTIQINKPKKAEGSTTEVEPGKVYDNKAARGGGVYVTGGGDLTVLGGYVIENYAWGAEVPGSAFATGDDLNALNGIGGGIFVSDGVSSTDRSTFTLKGEDEGGVAAAVAIYGNIADFAADDVFSNGNNTQLNVPKVGNMNLAEYTKPVDSWVEDYAIGDSNYTRGLNGLSSTDIGTGTNFSNVVRYRGAAMDLRVPVSEKANVTFTPNVADAYVCMTLGVPGIVADKVIIDFGLQVDIDVMINDRFSNSSNVLEIYVGPMPSTMTEVSQTAPGDGFISLNDTTDATRVSGAYGKMEFGSNGQLIYKLNGMQMPAHDKFCYVVKYVIGTDQTDTTKTYYYYSTVTIVPANTIYFEEDFKAPGVNGSAITYTQKTDGVTSNGWTSLQGTPGVSQDVSYIDLTEQDLATVFGYDSHYNSKYQFGMGGAKKTTVYTYKNAANEILRQKTAKAVFQFTGTGFDVISLTSNKTGTLLVNVFKLDADGNRIESYEYTYTDTDGTVKTDTKKTYKTLMVDTYYGYTLNDKGEWVVTSSDDETALYQIPVINVYGMPHDTYEVELYVAYNTFFDHDQYSDNDDLGGQYDFYLDGIRIYDPVKAPGSVVIETDAAGKDVTINDVYLHYGEAYPSYFELRDQLLPTDKADDIGTLVKEISVLDINIRCEKDATKKKALQDQRDAKKAELDKLIGGSFGNAGAVYIDGNKGTLTIGDAGFYGPNNEVYLNKGGAIVTTLNTANSNVDSIYLGLKSIKGGEGTIKISGTKDGKDFEATITVASGSDMYYDISGMTNLTIENTSADGVVIAITNVKVTYTSDPYAAGGTMEGDLFGTDVDYLSSALLSLTGDELAGTEASTDPELSLSYPSLSFEDEVYYNVYFTAGDMTDVVEMGLMILPSMLADGTMDDAIATIPGYLTNGDLYMVRTEGIAAANMGDTVYFKVYALLADGTYAYSTAGGYNAKAYADTVLSGEYADSMKALVVSMLSYGAEAQKFFGHNTDALMDAGLTAEQKALVGAYESTMMDAIVKADSSKTASFVRDNADFSELYPSVSFDGAFAINYYCQPSIPVDDGMTLYWWSAEDYAAVEELTLENASGSMTMELGDKYWGQVSGIAAKDMDKTYYVTCVFESEGETVTTGIISYSLGAYCQSKAATEGDAQQAFAQATAVYGYYAKQYFAQN